MDDDQKKTHLHTILRLYSKDRDIDSLGHSLDVILDPPIQRRLLSHIRSVRTSKQPITVTDLISSYFCLDCVLIII